MYKLITICKQPNLESWRESDGGVSLYVVMKYITGFSPVTKNLKNVYSILKTFMFVF